MNDTESGIFCPSCKMKNELGATVCAYCNTSLEDDSQKTITFKKIREDTGTLPDYYDSIMDAQTFAPERFMDFEIPSTGIILINLENGHPITVQTEKAFILGRISTEHKRREPLIDLTKLDADSLGISRAHALIRQTKDGYEIIDLESSNGTWHENQRLVPNQPYPIESGDRIRIGRLHMLVFYS